MDVLRDPKAFDLSRVPRAVAYRLAAGDAASARGLQLLSGLLATAGDIPLLVLDAGAFGPEHWKGQGLRTCPLALWIRDGRVLHTLDAFAQNDAARVLAYTQDIL